jgi:hypothetical protein
VPFPLNLIEALAKVIVVGFTVVASKAVELRIATDTTPFEPKLIPLGKLAGLMSIATVMALHFPALPAL